LQTGQTVEVITARNAKPNPAWLNFVVSAKARSSLRRFLRDMRAEDAERLGRRMLQQALESYGLDLKRKNRELERVAGELKIDSTLELLRRIGIGELPALLVARRFVTDADATPLSETTPIEIRGTEGFAVSLARCCHPVPGDRIAGLLTRGKGLVVHRVDCGNLVAQKDSDRVVDIAFHEEARRDYPAELRLELEDERGVLASVAATVSAEGSNIHHAQVAEREDGISVLTLELTVHDRSHLARIIRRLRKTTSVLRVVRT
jgi:GTP diphosphokinase / guanosine-3',5'-bis(diphosphate) 3'-diphosphatase